MLFGVRRLLILLVLVLSIIIITGWRHVFQSEAPSIIIIIFGLPFFFVVLSFGRMAFIPERLLMMTTMICVCICTHASAPPPPPLTQPTSLWAEVSSRPKRPRACPHRVLQIQPPPTARHTWAPSAGLRPSRTKTWPSARPPKSGCLGRRCLAGCWPRRRACVSAGRAGGSGWGGCGQVRGGWVGG